MTNDEQVVDPPHAPAGGDNPSETAGAVKDAGGGAAVPSADEAFETAVKAVEDLADDTPAEKIKEARENLKKAKTAREAAKAEATKAQAAAAEKAKAEALKNGNPADKDLDVSAEKLKLPENLEETASDYLKSRQASIAQFAKENKLSLSQAQKMLEADATSFGNVAAFGDARMKAKAEAWKAENQTDKTLGGAAYDANSVLAERALRTFFGNEFFDAELKNLHLTQHPTVFRQAIAFARQVGEARLVQGEKPTQKDAPKTLGESVYGKRGVPGGYNPTAIGGGSEPSAS